MPQRLLFIENYLLMPKCDMSIHVLMCMSVCSPHTLCVVLHSEPAPSAMTALHQFGAEMLRLSRGLEASAATKPQYRGYIPIGIICSLQN